jgi:dipeptidyl aminopeptidase/acylaminoacyl peptidase
VNRFIRAPALLAAAAALIALADDVPYQKPSKAILDALNASATPLLSVSPSKSYALLVEPSRNPPIADLAQPMMRLAGIRLDPKTNGPHASREVQSLTLMRLPDGAQTRVAAPAGGKLGRPLWNTDGSQFAFTNTTSSAIELWIGAAATGQVRRIEGVRINAMFPQPIRWMDSKTILASLVPANRGPAPVQPEVPLGPKVQEASGRAAGVWTNPDALTSAFDEQCFDYYGASQLTLIDAATGKSTPFGKVAIYTSANPSPDERHLLVTAAHRPYTYLHVYSAFPKEVEIWDRTGKVERKIASLPLEDRVPVDGVPVGPRNFVWRADQNGTLMWVEALDGGNPKEKVPNRDRVLALKAPYRGEPEEQFKVQNRFVGASFVEGTAFAMVTDLERNRRWVRTQLIDLDHPNNPPKTIVSRDMRDRYQDSGSPVTKPGPNGQPVAVKSGDTILFTGPGASPKGDLPFLNAFDLKEQKTSTLFRSDDSHYEEVVAVLDDAGARFITRRESPADPPNYFLHDGAKLTALTHFPDPVPALRAIKRQLVTYKRADGVPLSFTLYTPPNYVPGTKLPTVVWAYPLEYDDAATAGQINGSTNRFLTITGPSHLFFLLDGYAILDNAAMPVVGSIDKVNDTYIDQVVSSAKAAIDKAVEMGVTDPDRVGVGGHSYGAFMTANLLANSNLFRAGIARSGAYNRTLTPFGFQSERRTLWEAPETYLKMSPFMNAQKIKTPILLIHGEADNNQGTFPIQSERMYMAIRGNGGTVRYVVLPHEAHGYMGRESVEHTLYEMLSWFDKHVKNAPPLMAPTNP